MNRVLVASAASVAALLIVAGGGYAWAVHEANARLEAAMEAGRSHLRHGAVMTYESATVHPFSAAAEIFNLTVVEADGSRVAVERTDLLPSGTGKGSTVHGVRLKADHLPVWSSAVGGRQTVITVASFDVENATREDAATGAPPDAASISFDRFTANDVVVTMPTGPARLASFEIDNYGPGRLTSVTATRLSVPTPAGSVDHAGFKTLSLGNIDLAQAVASAIRHAPPQPQDPNNISIDVGGIFVAGHGVNVLSAERAELASSGDVQNSTGRLDVSGIVFRPNDPKGQAALAGLGLTEIDANFDEATEYHAAGGTISARQMLSVGGLGTLRIDLDLAGLDVKAVATQSRGNPMAAFAMLNQFKLVSAAAQFKDDGLLTRGLTLGAMQAQMNVDQMRAKVLGLIAQNEQLATFPGGSAIRAAAGDFVQHGGTITVAARPAEPLPLMEFASTAKSNPTAALSRLRIGATVAP